MKRFDQWKPKKSKEISLLERCRDTIRKVDLDAEVILYGSVARGEAGQDSDYDLLVLVDGDVTLEREDIICRRPYPLELETGKILTVFVYNRNLWNTPLYRAMPFHQNVDRDGVVL